MPAVNREQTMCSFLCCFVLGWSGLGFLGSHLVIEACDPIALTDIYIYRTGQDGTKVFHMRAFRHFAEVESVLSEDAGNLWLPQRRRQTFN